MNSRKSKPYSIRDSSRRARVIYWFGERVRGWNTTCRHQHITQNFGHVIGWPYSDIYRHIPGNSRWAGLARHWDTVSIFQIRLTKSSPERQKSASKTRNAYFAKTSHRAPKTPWTRPEGDRGVPQPYEARETSFGKVVKQPYVVSNPSHNQIQNNFKVGSEKSWFQYFSQ